MTVSQAIDLFLFIVIIVNVGIGVMTKNVTASLGWFVAGLMLSRAYL